MVSNFCLSERLVNVPGIWWEWQWWSPSGWSFFSSWVTEKIEKAHLRILVVTVTTDTNSTCRTPETLDKARMATIHLTDLTVYIWYISIYFNLFQSFLVFCHKYVVVPQAFTMGKASCSLLHDGRPVEFDLHTGREARWPARKGMEGVNQKGLVCYSLVEHHLFMDDFPSRTSFIGGFPS